MRTSRLIKYPHVVKLPHGAVSPTNSIYKHYDIVVQGAVLCRYLDAKYTIRSMQPFTLRYALNGKTSEVSSKHVAPK